jgi:hypothetical protein
MGDTRKSDGAVFLPPVGSRPSGELLFLEGPNPEGCVIDTKNLRAKILDEATRDAVAYYGEFRCAAGADGLDWVNEAWADLRRDFKLSADQADSLWPAYWKAFFDETVRLASIRVVGE